MGWKFWQSNNGNGASNNKLPKPKEIPERIGRHLVVQEKMDPDTVWNLKCALRPPAPGQTSSDFRVFSENAAQDKGVMVANFDSLDGHPELIILQGQFDKDTKRVEIQQKG